MSNLPELATPALEMKAVKAESVSVLIEQSRAIQEVQGAITMAKKFPRDELIAYNRVIDACKRKNLAESAMYAFPRGGTMVTGPSIRLAETIAKAWGNIQFGIVELDQGAGYSDVMSYAWDLETNTRSVKVFKVPHERHSKKGIQRLTDPRDIYEMVANQGARRLRSCIFAIIPADVMESAVEQCEKTIANQSDEPIIDRVKKMLAKFAEFGITKAMIEKRLGHLLDATTAPEIVTLTKIYRSLKDGMAPAEQFFDIPSVSLDIKDESKDEKK